MSDERKRVFFAFIKEHRGLFPKDIVQMAQRFDGGPTRAHSDDTGVLSGETEDTVEIN